MGLLPIAGRGAGSEFFGKASRELLELGAAFDFLFVIAATLPVVDRLEELECKFGQGEFP